jgi:hypothetical protein
MRTFLDELDPEDEEHGAAWLADDDGNTLEYEVSGNLCFSRGENSRHLSQVPKDQVLALWKQLALGDLDGLEELPWQPGARPPMSPEERAARECANAEAQLYLDRHFYDSLGEERAAVPCRSSGCARGSVSLSVLGAGPSVHAY